jgi:hypothetical protein
MKESILVEGGKSEKKSKKKRKKKKRENKGKRN